MKKIIWILILIGILILISLLFYAEEESNIIADKSNLITVYTPSNNQEIISPFLVTGEARGFWFFEADFPIRLIDADGKEIATAIAQAQGEWMTEDFVPFEAKLEFAVPGTETGTLILHKDNPSGLPEHDDELKIPIKFKNSSSKETMTLKVFFGSNREDPKGLDCSLVFPVLREIPKTQGVARAAILELLKGPSESERVAGFFTSINNGVKLKSINIKDAIAHAEFDETLGEKVAGSCLVTAIRVQIETTLKQFETIKDVVISIDGNAENILEP